MKKNDMMMYLMMAGGAYLVYWYLTKNGPSPGVTYWDSWFGGAQVPAPTQGTVTQTPSGTTVVVTAPPPVVDVRTRLLTASGGVNTLNADQWNYYRNMLFPPALNGDQFSRAFPVRTDPMPAMSVDQFLATLQAAGINASTGLGGLGRMGDIVPTQSVASIPSMSFGGSLRNAVPGSSTAFRGAGARDRGQGGGYIQ